MAIRHYVGKLGSPNIQLQGLKIWVHGRQYPETTDYWDANWLLVTAECASNDSKAHVSGPIIHLSELAAWADAADQLSHTLVGEANLECIEPELSVSIAMSKSEKTLMTVDLNRNDPAQKQSFQFDLDPTCLPVLSHACRQILESYPARSE